MADRITSVEPDDFELYLEPVEDDDDFELYLEPVEDDTAAATPAETAAPERVEQPPAMQRPTPRAGLGVASGEVAAQDEPERRGVGSSVRRESREAKRQPSKPDPFEGESIGETAKRRGQQFARGATEVVASVPEAAAIQGEISDRSIAADATGYVRDAQDRIAEINRRLADRPDMPQESRDRLMDERRQAEATVRNYSPISEGSAAEAAIEPARDRDLYKKGRVVRAWTADTFGAPDPRDQSFWAQLAEGGGNMTGFAVGSLAATVFGGGVGGIVTGAGLGSSLTSSGLYREAVEAGISNEDALDVAKWGSAIGATEIIPIARALKMIPASARQKVSGAFGKRLSHILRSGGEEAAQEFLAETAQNIVASEYFDPERGWFEGAGEAALIGGILGVAVGGAGAIRPDRSLTPEDRASSLPDDVISKGKAKLAEIEEKGKQGTTARFYADVPEGAVPMETLYGRGGLGPVETPEVQGRRPTPPNLGISPAVDDSSYVATPRPAEGVPNFNDPAAWPQPENTDTAPNIQERNGPPPTPAEPQVENAVPSQKVAAPKRTAARPKVQKRPFTAEVKRIGIHPDGALAAELRAQDITPSTVPGLFKRTGVKDMDNLPADEWPDWAPKIGEDGQGYLDRQGIIDALIEENAGRPVQVGRQAELQAELDAKAELEQARANGELDATVDAAPEADLGFIDIAARDQDIRTDQERRSDIEATTREAIGSTGLEGVLSDAEIGSVVDRLDANGGNVEDALWWAAERELEDAGRERTENDAEDIPFGDEAGELASREGDADQAGRGLDTVGPGSVGPVEAESVEGGEDGQRAPVGVAEEGGRDAIAEADPVKAAIEAARAAGEVEHTTRKGKRLVGYVLNGIDRETAKGIDKFTFKKDGGFFIRAQHVSDGATPRIPESQKPNRSLEAEAWVAQEAEEREAATRKKRADTLRTMGRKAVERADADLGADRQTNTARRARMAAGAIGEATAKKRNGETAAAIADAQAAGAGPLDTVKSVRDVERIETALRRAQYAGQRQRGEGMAEREKAGPPTMDDVQHMEPPSVLVRNGVLRTLIEKVKGKRGAPTKALQDMQRRRGDDFFKVVGRDVETIEAALKIAKKQGALDYDLKGLASDVTDYSAMTRLFGEDQQAFFDAYFDARSGTAVKKDPVQEARQALMGQKIPGFFETPEALAERMVQEAGLSKGEKVLEPSAGLGRIANAAADVVGKENVDVIERNATMQGSLTAQGFNLVGTDFTEFDGGPYDVILMNPPFEKGQDAEHIRRAYGMLKPGGRLVAISGEGIFFRSDAKSTEFREWLDDLGGTSEKLPEGTFKESGTGTNTRIVNVGREWTAADYAEVDRLEADKKANAPKPEMEPLAAYGMDKFQNADSWMRRVTEEDGTARTYWATRRWNGYDGRWEIATRRTTRLPKESGITNPPDKDLGTFAETEAAIAAMVADGLPKVEPSEPQAAQRAREAAPLPTESTPEGEQSFIPGTRDDQGRDGLKDQAEIDARQQQSKMRRGGQERVEDDAGGLFADPMNNADLFDAPAAGSETDTPSSEPVGSKFENKQPTTLEDYADTSKGRVHVYGEFGGGRYYVGTYENYQEAEAAASAKGRRHPGVSFFTHDRADSTSINGTEDDLQAAMNSAVNNSAQESENQPEAEAPAPTDKIEDFGEVLEGAAKHRAAEWAGKVENVPDADIINQPLSKSWPEPKYDQMIEDGVDPVAVAFIRAARDETPNKPASNWKKKRWAEQVRVLRQFALDLANGVYTMNQISEKAEGVGSIERVLGRGALYERFGHDKSLKGIDLSIQTYTMKDGKYHNPALKVWEVTQPRKATAWSNMPRTLASGETMSEAVEAFAAVYESLDASKKSGAKPRKQPFQIWTDRRDGKYHVGKKVGSDYTSLATFDEISDARKYRDENADELAAKLARWKEIPFERNRENRDRIGEDRRDGRDVQPDTFQQAFGFRGVQFGNYVEGPRRQADLNRAYDALSDLAAVVDIPTEAISLNGSLGLAFGARGKGGKNAGAAHFEPDNIVINLTKRQGAGSLAHEWWHGLDNYFARMRGLNLEYLSERTRGTAEGVRPEMVEAFANVVRAIEATGVPMRSRELDQRRSKPYWNQVREKTARTFEQYIIHKVEQAGGSNDFLANIVSEGTWRALDAMEGREAPSYPYLKESEQAAVFEAFDAFFDTIESEATESGVRLYQEGSADADPARIDAAMADLRKRLDKIGLKNVDLQRDADMDEQAAFEADGRGNMRILIGAAADPEASLRHEAIHALKASGVFTKAEWAALEKRARSVWMGQHKIKQRYSDLSEEAQIEEAIAEGFANWKADAPASPIKNAFAKVKRFFRAVRDWMQGQGIQDADDLFGAIERGEVGGRESEGATETRKSQRQAARDEDLSDEIGERIEFAVDPETTAEERQESFLKAAASQPLDSAFKVLFMPVGGIDAQGKWRLGVEMERRVTDAVANAKFKDDSLLSFMNPAIERARIGLRDRHGLPEEYVEMERQRGIDQSLIMSEGLEFVREMQSADMGPQEAQVLQAILTGEAVDEDQFGSLPAAVRQSLDEMGQEAVRLGLLSPEAYERNRGTYLHRVYEGHEAQVGPLGKMTGSMARGRRVKIAGEQFKGRGIFEEVDAAAIWKGNEEYLGAKRGAPQKGDKVIILDKMSDADQGGLEGVEPGKPRRERRVYWPAEQAIPARFASYENRGTFEVRGEPGKTITLWRDFTKEERTRMGEILDARYTVAKTYHMMAQDLATGKFFKGLAENEDWVKAKPPAGAVVAGEDKKFSRTDPSVEWVRVPATKIGQSETLVYGALAGKYIRADIWRDMEELKRMQSPGWWRPILTQWKLNKTARNPVVHMNNIMSNFMLMDMANVRITDLGAAWSEIRGNGELYEEAKTHGAFGADMVAQEIRRDVLEPILKELRDEIRGGKGGLEAEAARIGLGPVGWIADRMVRGVAAADRKMVSAYQMEDEIFRMATYIRRRKEGMSAQEAAIEARDQFLNYDIRAPWVNAGRNSVLPFISYTYRAIPRLFKTLMERPWKMWKYATVAYMVNSLGYLLAPSDDDEEAERGSLRKEEQGKTWVGTERLIRMPWLSGEDPVFLDTRRWIPGGDIFETGQNEALPWVPNWLQVGGPIVLAGEIVANRSLFTGEDIVNEVTDTGIEKAAKQAGHLYRSWMPSAPWIPEGWYWNKIGRALNDEARTYSGDSYRLSDALLSSVGIKLQPKDVDFGYQMHGFRFDQEEREISMLTRSLKRQRSRGLISQENYDREIARLRKKSRRLDEARRETFDKRR